MAVRCRVLLSIAAFTELRRIAKGERKTSEDAILLQEGSCFRLLVDMGDGTYLQQRVCSPSPEIRIF